MEARCRCLDPEGAAFEGDVQRLLGTKLKGVELLEQFRKAYAHQTKADGPDDNDYFHFIVKYQNKKYTVIDLRAASPYL